MADFFLTGGCLCGSIRYEITGPILRSYACHCNFARKLQAQHLEAQSV